MGLLVERLLWLVVLPLVAASAAAGEAMSADGSCDLIDLSSNVVSLEIDGLSEGDEAYEAIFQMWKHIRIEQHWRGRTMIITDTREGEPQYQYLLIEAREGGEAEDE